MESSARKSAFASIMAVVASFATAGGSEDALRVRVTEAAAPCVAAAAAAYPGPRVSLDTGGFRDPGRAEVLVLSRVEMTRALETAAAVSGTETDVARIPWVLSVESGNPLGLASLADLGRPGLRVFVLAGPAAYEARKKLQAQPPERVEESVDEQSLRRAPVALVPLSLAGAGDRIAVDVPPIVARAAVATRAARPDAAREFVAFLGSEAGQRAFAACGQQER